MEKIEQLRCNGEEYPLSVEDSNIVLTFKVVNEGVSLDTSKVAVQIADSEETEKNLINQAEKSGEGMVSLTCEVKELKAHTRYYYRINVWNQDFVEIGWSDWSWFETGFLGEEKQTSFIRADYEKERKEESECLLMRRDFEVSGKIKRAKVYVTAKGLYEFRMNGEKIGKDYLTPGFTNYKCRTQYQAYDVTNRLKEGKNTVGFILGDGWYKGYINWNEKRNWYGDHKAAFMYLRIEKEDGDVEVLRTDEAFTWAVSPILVSEIYHGEVYDARREIKGWDTPEFDAQQLFRPVLLDRDGTDTLIPTENTPVRCVRTLKPLRMIRTPKGETLVDFGQILVGNVRITVSGERGQKVHIKHGEMLDKEGNFYCENIAPSKQEVEYILSGEGTETYLSRFTFQDFRYIKILEFPGEPTADCFEAEVWSSFDEETGMFRCSDEKINQLYRNTKWSQRGNFIDVPIAGPQRTERLGWTGDAQIFAKTACYHMDVRRFYKKWLNDLRTEQFATGAVPWVVPNVLGDEEYECLDFFTPVQKDPTSAAWGDAALIIPWELYQQYGDKEVLENQYESMKRYVEYMRNTSGGEEIFEEGFHYGDWFALDAYEGSFVGATPKALIATAFYAYSTGILSKAAGVLGKEAEQKEYQELREKIKAAFIKKYCDQSGRMTVETQTACVLALQFGLIEEAQIPVVSEQLMEYLKARNGHLATGFVGTGYILHVLAKYGHPKMAYQLLFNEDCPSWLYQVNCGATTIWEHWDGYKPDGSFWEPWMNSFNHYAYGCVGDFLYSAVAGIVPDEQKPGYQHFYLRPIFTDRLGFAECSLETVRGEIYVKWEKETDGYAVEVRVPFTSTATLIVPEEGKETIKLLKTGNYNFKYKG